MNKDDIIRMAREAECSETWGGDAFKFTVEELERFAALVAEAEAERISNQARHIIKRAEARGAEAEREACAAIANEHKDDCYDGDQDWYKCRSIEEAIRARGNK
jgi:uncharacterized membrane protein